MFDIAFGIILGFFGLLGSLIALGLTINVIRAIYDWISSRF